MTTLRPAAQCVSPVSSGGHVTSVVTPDIGPLIWSLVSAHHDAPPTLATHITDPGQHSLTSHSLSVKLYILLLCRQHDPDTLFPLFTFTLNFHLTESIISSSCYYESTLKILKYHVQMQLFLENTWRRDDSGVTLRCHWAPPLSTGHRHQL